MHRAGLALKIGGLSLLLSLGTRQGGEWHMHVDPCPQQTLRHCVSVRYGFTEILYVLIFSSFPVLGTERLNSGPLISAAVFVDSVGWVYGG